MRKSERYASLRQEIENATDKQIQAIEKNYRIFYDQEMAKFNAQLKATIAESQQKQLAEQAKAKLSAYSQDKIKYRQALLIYRQQLVDELFEELTNRLRDFVGNSDYPDWLNMKITEVLSDSTYHQGTLYCGVIEAQLLNSQIVKFKLQLVSTPDLIGGFILRNHQASQEYDVSFINRVNQQKQKFYQNSGFIVPQEDL